ncbi:MAG: FeoA family protein [Candidatus Kariarchaeaceae archaeon]|jgi:Fe2+ transport system protein FeoA
MSEIVKLSYVRPDEEVNLQEVTSCMSTSTSLAEMGIVGDVLIQMLHNIGRGPVLIKVRNTQLMIGRGLASKIK